MKKIFLFSYLLLVATAVQAAKVGFLVVGANNNQDALPWEGGFWDDSSQKNLVDASPERDAYKWFADTYTADSKEYILISTLQAANSEVPSDIDVLWVNLDRNGNELNWTENDPKSYDVIFNVNVVHALKEFVKRGGNLLLTKQAVRLVAMMGRTDMWPSCEINGYAESAVSGSVQEIGSADYKVFSGCIFESYKYPLLSGSYDVNREAVWTKTGGETAEFESGNNCKIIGRDGESFDKVGFVEFYPATISSDVYKGTILVMGLHAYQWSQDNTNTLKANVKKVTGNMLDYLSVKPTDVSVNWQGWETAANGYIGASLVVPNAPTAGDHISHISTASYTSSDYNVASVHAMNGDITYNYFGSATITSTVTVAGDGQWVPKNVAEVSKEKSVTVSGGNSSATIGYILTANQSLFKLTNEYENIANPDKTAAQWFYTNYVSAGTGRFLNPAEAIPEGIQVLWINSDRKELGSDAYLAELGGSDFVSRLRTWLGNNHNLFVSKQATRLIGDLQRLGEGVYPTYGESSGGNDSWDYGTHGPFNVGNNFTAPVSEEHSTHAIYKTLAANPTLMNNGTHTNRNYVIKLNNSWDGLTSHEAFDSYQTTHDCRLLGDWGNDAAKYECGGIVEFYPKDNLGTIIMVGLGAYQWISQPAALETLTSNILAYLNTTSAPAIDWVTAPVDGEAGESQNVAVTFADGPVWWSMDPDNGTVLIDVDTNHPIESEYKLMTLNQAGTVTITASRSGDGYALPRNVTPTSISKTITVAPGVYTRESLSPETYYTICLPKAASSYEGAVMFRLADKTADDGIVIEEVAAMNAGEPYIFRATETTLTVNYAPGNKVAAMSVNGLVGYIGEETLTLTPNDNHYILAYNKIWQVDVSIDVPANRAYIDMSAINAIAPAPGRKRYVISGTNTTTALDQMEVKDLQNAKVLQNGTLYIIKNGVQYNAQGQMIQ